MNFPREIQNILESLIDRIGREQVLKPSFGKYALISYSGGKDSSILLLFYEYLHSKYLIPRPHIFHLNHQIRDNDSQENEIVDFIRSRYPHFDLKKKIFLT
ncbi:arginosuccinate synthase [Leptospira ognonensis]|uniref:Arginosuccinate synthase n=1 Tax=Leptospira ognonensis TaxID=2484945 RepID=A0A4R9K4D7_9LEPT|nr:ATP-binding protein [Leptospira ognonensis]TGL59168.1 arginosuccinate synthase [Leptospira ognonensis]